MDVERLEGVHELQVLPCDALQGNVVNVHLVLLDEVEQEVERAFEDLEFHFCIPGTWVGETSGPVGRLPRWGVWVRVISNQSMTVISGEGFSVKGAFSIAVVESALVMVFPV